MASSSSSQRTTKTTAIGLVFFVMLLGNLYVYLQVHNSSSSGASLARDADMHITHHDLPTRLDNNKQQKEENFQLRVENENLKSQLESLQTKYDQLLSSSTTSTASTAISTAASPSTTSTAISSSSPTLIKDFEPQEGVVIATKIHGDYHWKHLRQMLCLLKYAYNDRVHYPIVVFSTLPVAQSEIDSIKELVAPASFQLVVDNPGLPEMIANLPKPEQQDLYERCNATKPEDFHWQTSCMGREQGFLVKIRYNWQAEFRTYHLWQRPELKPYKYMLWLDADGFPTQKWQQDPVATAMRHNMVLFFAQFPAGRSKGPRMANVMEQAFGKRICHVKWTDGHLVATEGSCKNGADFRQAHGFFHITNLDFYRTPAATKAFHTMVSAERFSRSLDDQLAITLVGSVLEPNRTCGAMLYYGVDLQIFHNGVFMGDKKNKADQRDFSVWWQHHANVTFPEAYGQCKVDVYG